MNEVRDIVDLSVKYAEWIRRVVKPLGMLKFSEISDALITPEGNIIPFNRRALEVQKIFNLTPLEFQRRFNAPADNALLSRGYIYVNGGMIQAGVSGSGLTHDQIDLITQYINTLPKNTEVDLTLLKHDANSFKLIEETHVYQGTVKGALDELLNMPSQTGELAYQSMPNYQFVPQKGGVPRESPSGGGWKQQFKFQSSLRFAVLAEDYQHRDDYYKPKEEQGRNPQVLYSVNIPEGLFAPNGQFYPVAGKGFAAHNALAAELINNVPSMAANMKVLLDIVPQIESPEWKEYYEVTVTLMALNYLLRTGWVRVNDATEAFTPTEQGAGIAFSGFDIQRVLQRAKAFLDTQTAMFKEILIDVFMPQHENAAEHVDNIISVYEYTTGHKLSEPMKPWIADQSFSATPKVVFQGTQEDFMDKYSVKSGGNMRFSDVLSLISHPKVPKIIQLVSGRTHYGLPVGQMDGLMYAFATDDMADKAAESASGKNLEELRIFDRSEFIGDSDEQTISSYYMHINDLPKEVLRSLGINRGYEGQIYVYELD